MADKRIWCINDARDFDDWYDHEVFYGVSDDDVMMYAVRKHKEKYIICESKIEMKFPWIFTEVIEVAHLQGAANYLKLAGIKKFRLTEQKCDDDENISLTSLCDLKYIDHATLITLL